MARGTLNTISGGDGNDSNRRKSASPVAAAAGEQPDPAGG